ncbi:MAG: FHA domain-containing protein [Polyangiaceae bacterium]
MPVTIYVRSADEDKAAEECPSLTFDGPRVVIGRGVSSDVRLPDASVSHRHATLHVEAGGVTISDDGSRNGTFVARQRLAPRAPHTLKSGDLVRLGRVWLEVRVDQRPATSDLSIATKDLAIALVSRALSALGEDATTRVVVGEGVDQGAFIALAEEGRPYVIGRGETCDLPLADTDASREHVQIVRRGATILVRDLDSKNGAALDGALLPAGRDVVWKSTQTLYVGGSLLVLDEPAAAALQSIEDAADEPLADADVPPAPRARSAPPVAEMDKSEAAVAAARAATKSAPVASPEPEPARKTEPQARVPAADATIVIAAIVILALSLAGLFWLLRT